MQVGLITAAVTLIAAVTCASVAARHQLMRALEKRARHQAVRLHAQNWTHGQIAVAMDRDPAQIAQWLTDADRSRGA